MEAAAAEMPEKPSGAKGVNLSMLMTGRASTMNRVSAATLIATSTALTVALSFVPMTSNQVTSDAISIAGRFTMPPSNGPRVSRSGMSRWNVCSIRPTT